LADMIAQGGHAERRAGSRLDEGNDLLVAVGPPPDHRGLHDIGMGIERRLDFGGIDVEAGTDDELLGPADDEQVAIVGTTAEVAGMKPAVIADGGTSRGRVAIVALHEIGPLIQHSPTSPSGPSAP